MQIGEYEEYGSAIWEKRDVVMIEYGHLNIGLLR